MQATPPLILQRTFLPLRSICLCIQNMYDCGFCILVYFLWKDSRQLQKVIQYFLPSVHIFRTYSFWSWMHFLIEFVCCFSVQMTFMKFPPLPGSCFFFRRFLLGLQSINFPLHASSDLVNYEPCQLLLYFAFECILQVRYRNAINICDLGLKHMMHTFLIYHAK